MVLFLRKKEPTPAPEYVPTDLVRRYAAEGLAEPEISARLARQGFRPEQISRALRAALKAEVVRPPAPPTPTMEMPRRALCQHGLDPAVCHVCARPAAIPPPPPPPKPPVPPAPPPIRIERPPGPAVEVPRPPPAMPPPPPRPLAVPPREIGVPPERIVERPAKPVMLPAPPKPEEMIPAKPPPPPPPPEAPAEITLEEIIEGVVAERWEAFEERLGSFEKRDIQLQSQIADLRKRFNELEKAMREREADLIKRFEAFGESMTSIEGRIGGIEKVFKEFLPQLTETTRAVAEIVEKLKAAK